MRKAHLEVEEYVALLKTPCLNGGKCTSHNKI
jgi:hypothetical protein